MALFGALAVGVSGLQAQSSAISVVSDNISNAGTNGYKEESANFSDLITDDSTDNYSTDNGGNGSVTGYNPSGVLAGFMQFNDVQGDISSASSPTDVAISGSGFFPVSATATSSADSMLYTRAGSFTKNGDGNLVNDAGYFLQGWPLDANGNLSSGLSSTDISSSAGLGALQPVDISQDSVAATPTSTISLQINLDASQAVYAGTPPYDPTSATANMASGSITPQFSTPVTIIDSTGVSHNFEAGFLKTGANTWAVEVYAQPASDVTAASGQVAAGTVTFNGDASLASVSASLTNPAAISWTDGAAGSAITYNWGTAGAIAGTPNATAIGETDGLSQKAGSFNVGNIDQNGSLAGSLTGISITSDGYVAAAYSNNTSRNLYKIPLADFIDPDQLQNMSGDVFSETANSGTPVFNSAGQGGAGTLDASSLEASNVDIASQLTTMIIAQNAYQSNSKLVSTSNEMLTDLVSMGVP